MSEICEHSITVDDDELFSVLELRAVKRPCEKLWRTISSITLCVSAALFLYLVIDSMVIMPNSIYESENRDRIEITQGEIILNGTELEFVDDDIPWAIVIPLITFGTIGVISVGLYTLYETKRENVIERQIENYKGAQT